MKRLFRSRNNRVIAGVCGGIGEYLDIDPVIIRIAWLASTLLGGMSILIYIIAWIVIPDAKDKKNLVDHWSSGKRSKSDSREIELIIGLFLLFIGVAFLLNNVGWIFWSWPITFAVGLIVIGLIIIFTRRQS